MPSILLDSEPESLVSSKSNNIQPMGGNRCENQALNVTPVTSSAVAAISIASQPSPPQRYMAYKQPTPHVGGGGISFLSTSLEQYRLQLYNYAVHMDRLRCPEYVGKNHSNNIGQQLIPSNSTAAAVAAFGYTNVAAAAAASAAVSVPNYAPVGNRLSLSMSLFPQRIFQPEEPKPQHSYIGLIAMAILSAVDSKLVLSDIYQYILDNYAYFRSRGPGWRNSIRHNLSLNDCFVKSGRSANGKGHYWAIHPANIEDFRKGDFRRRKAQRKVRKHMGLSVDDEGTDSPSPPPLAMTPPPLTISHQHHLQHHQQQLAQCNANALGYLQQQSAAATAVHHQLQQSQPSFHAPYFGQSFMAAAAVAAAAATTPHERFYMQPSERTLPTPHKQLSIIKKTTTTTASVIANLYSQSRKRQFDVASLLAPDVDIDVVDGDDSGAATAEATTTTTTTRQRTLITKLSVQQHHQQQQQQHHQQQLLQQQLHQNLSELDEQEDIDVVASDAEADADELEESLLLHEDDEQLQHDSNHNNSISNSSSKIQQLQATTAAPSFAPHELGHVVDPRIFGCYYGSYMAAAAAQQVVARHFTSTISFPLVTAAAVAAANTSNSETSPQQQPQQQHTHQYQQLQPQQ